MYSYLNSLYWLYLFLVHIAILLPSDSFSQFAPAAGEPGSTAIHRDSSVFVEWATECVVNRGYINFSDTSVTDKDTNMASFGTSGDALGKADGLVVSLGDGGKAELGFEYPIKNGESYDFAVFENGFKSQSPPYLYFLELGFVEVSSDSEKFIRFPSVSQTQTDEQIADFGQLDPVNIYNLAGKYVVDYGTPFDLEDIKDSSGIILDNIIAIRIIDVAGSINDTMAAYDSKGNIINDPWPTPFWSCGFDLDAVGVLHAQLSTLSARSYNVGSNVFPNPAKPGDKLHLVLLSENQNGPTICRLYDMTGKLVFEKKQEGRNELSFPVPFFLQSGIYLLKIGNCDLIEVHKLIINK